MEVITNIIGDASAPEHHDALHRLEHAGAVERITLPRADLARKRLRAVTDKGVETAIALPRDVALFHGALLLLTETRAVVLRVEAERWLTLLPKDAAAALALGYHAGNLHWRVRFEGALLRVAVENPLDTYLSRLDAFLVSGDATIEDEAQAEGEPLGCAPLDGAPLDGAPLEEAPA